ncbi:MAG: hypothetical protein IPJ48_17910 [Propionivibrio sp.]|jgi:hypothetical protein|uniref:Uncharacterized protein n=1 Tax=Candidatus Propionivibrio dominans TaxID=2954373 RepID=A0A9D7I8X6_9RHOO|nr:hypothetical protein [Candidatus Propionivibrio dominans]
MTSLQTELASLRAENMELKNNVTICVVRMGELHKQVTLLRGHLLAIRKNAIKRDRYWVENMADQALTATEPKGK